MKFVEAGAKAKTGTPQTIFLTHVVVRRLFFSRKYEGLLISL